MKVRSHGTIDMMSRGFSTLEILIALGLLSAVLAAVTIVSFGDQSLLSSTQTEHEALSEGERMVKYAQALARKDFRLVQATTTSKDIYTNRLEITQHNDFVKQVTATVSWQDSTLTLKTLLADYEDAIGGDTCYSVPTGDWAHPRIAWSSTLDDLIGTTTADTYAIGGVDAYKGRLYVTASKTAYSSDPTLFVFDVSDPLKPTLLGMTDDSSTNKDGLNQARIAEDRGSGKLYAYAASSRPISSAGSFGQLQIVDVTSPSDTWTPVITRFKVPGLTVGTPSDGGVGNSLFYTNGLIFLGLTSAAGHGPELHIIDVMTPTAPHEVGAWPSGGMRHDVNAIYARNGYAFLAHADGGSYDEQLEVLDVHDPSRPTEVSTFHAPSDIGGNGKALFAIGDTVYLGRTATNITGVPDTLPEWLALDAEHGTITPSALASSSLSRTGDSVDATLIRGNLAFLLTNTRLTILHADTGEYVAELPLPISGSHDHKPTFDCEGNTIYGASNDGSDNGTLFIITAP